MNRPTVAPPRLARRLFLLLAFLTWSPVCDLLALIAYIAYVIVISPLLVFTLVAAAVGVSIATTTLGWILRGMNRIDAAHSACQYHPLADLAALLRIPESISRSEPPGP